MQNKSSSTKLKITKKITALIHSNLWDGEQWLIYSKKKGAILVYTRLVACVMLQTRAYFFNKKNSGDDYIFREVKKIDNQVKSWLTW